MSEQVAETAAKHDLFVTASRALPTGLVRVWFKCSGCDMKGAMSGHRIEVDQSLAELRRVHFLNPASSCPTRTEREQR